MILRADSPQFASRREFDLDPFRGLVCLWLVGLHFCAMSEIQWAAGRFVGPDVAGLGWDLRLGVESFLVLAGFMMAHMLRPVPAQDVRLSGYFARRCCRLLLPFAVAVLLAAADRWTVHLLFGKGTDRPDLGSLLAQLFLVNEFFGVNEPAIGYWSMVTLEQFYLLWLVGLALLRWTTGGPAAAAYGRAFRGMGTVSFLVFLGSGAAFVLVEPMPVQLVQHAFYIALGFLLYGNLRLGLFRWELRIAVMVMLGAAVWFQHSRLAAALVCMLVLYALALGRRFPGGAVFRGLGFVGQRSYSLYLLHAVVGMRILTGFRFVNKYGDWTAIPLLLTAIAGSLAAASLFYVWVERPSHNLARRIRYRADGTGAADRGLADDDRARRLPETIDNSPAESTVVVQPSVRVAGAAAPGVYPAERPVG